MNYQLDLTGAVCVCGVWVGGGGEDMAGTHIFMYNFAVFAIFDLFLEFGAVFSM